MYVCYNCFEDSGLIAFIKKNAMMEICDFCSAEDEESIAADIDDVSAHFVKCLFLEYSLAENHLGWEGEYIGEHWDAWDLVYEIDLDFPNGNMDSLLPHLFGEYRHDVWCKRNPYGLDGAERSSYSWERFCDVVMHERRYFFLEQSHEEPYSEVYRPGEILSMLFDYAQGMNLFKKLPTGTQLSRARWEGDSPPLKTPGELGPPPVEKALQSNRMSPAGIPMFYACDNEETALKETASSPGDFAVGRFETLRPITVLDLTGIPPIPSLFEEVSDSAEIIPREALIFLHNIVTEISRPIDRDNKVHITYVPTQVVTEYIRDRLTWGKTPIDGIKYRSSVHPDHASYVLFATQRNVESASDEFFRSNPWLKLVEVNHRRWPDDYESAC